MIQPFSERLEMAVSALGLDMAPLAFDIAKAPWETPADMQNFLEALTGYRVDTP